MKTPIFAVVAIAAMFVLQGCASQPDRVAELENARTVVQSAANDAEVQQYAGEELDKAQAALARADEAWREREPLAAIRHEAYLASRHAEIAIERAAEAGIHDQIARSKNDRQQVLLNARSAEADSARQLAERKSAEADYARARATSAMAEAQALEAEIAALKAEQTDRGIVLTLDDVLFDHDRAQLKPGAKIAMDRIAGFLDANPARRVLVEGHTDATGSTAYNANLSDSRARAVAAELVARGIARDRVEARGLGESYPVATNDTEAGRQENRRVEVIVSDADGDFPAAASR